jgi:outer membrane protein insertion porin family
MKPLFIYILTLVACPALARAQAEPEATSSLATISRQADLQLVGNTHLSESELRNAGSEIFQNIEAKGLTPPRADDAAFYLEVYYRRKGYTFALVNWQIINNGRTLKFEIEEGPLTNIGQTIYQGNDHFDAATLDNFLLGMTRQRLSKFTTQLPYVEQDIETGASRIASYYRSEGYLDVQVVPWPIEYTGDLSIARLGFSIVEGRQYWFNRIGIQGASPELEAGIREKIAEKIKFPATELRMDSLQQEIQSSLKAVGYYKAEVSIASLTFNRELGFVDMDVVIKGGDRYIYDGITVKGTERLLSDFLPIRFSSLKNTTYNSEKQDEIYREVISTGLFAELRIKEVALPDHRIRLDLELRENPAKEFGLYAGYGTYEGGFVGASYQDRNLLGNGRPLLTSVEISQRGITGDVEYVDPWFFGRGNELRVKIFSQSNDNDGYSIFDLGLRGEVTRKFSKIFKAAVYAVFKTAKASALEIDPILLGPLDYQTLTLGVNATLDLRNNPLAPVEGWVVDTSLGYEQISSGSGGIRASIRVSYYWQIGQGLLSLGARSSAFLTSTRVNQTPIDERYFNGGSTTVRSFAERELGPIYQNNYPLGGLSRTIFNAEFSYPLFGDLKGAVFLDSGNVPKEGRFFSASDFRYAYGLGLRYDLPVGPIRLDYGFNPDARPGEAAGALHFSFGVAF